MWRRECGGVEMRRMKMKCDDCGEMGIKLTKGCLWCKKYEMCIRAAITICQDDDDGKR